MAGYTHRKLVRSKYETKQDTKHKGRKLVEDIWHAPRRKFRTEGKIWTVQAVCVARVVST